MRKTILALGLAASLSAFSLTADAANAQNTTDYIMCPGDVLQVIVYGHEDLSTPMTAGATTSPYVVRPDGKVSFPLIGDVDVTGKNVTLCAARPYHPGDISRKIKDIVPRFILEQNGVILEGEEMQCAL